jgi:hypothetical protein
MKFAADTNVPTEKSHAEIRSMVSRAGGTRFATMDEEGRAIVLFEINQRRVMFELTLPKLEDFTRETQKYYRANKLREKVVDIPPEQQHRKWEQACRTHWRALALCIKAKLVSVESKVETFEEAFLAQIVVPDGNRTTRFANLAVKAIAQAYTGGKLPPLLGSGA